MTGKLPVATAELIGTFLECIGYGVYMVIFLQCLNIFRKKRMNTGLLTYLLCTMILSWMLITTHLAVDLTRVMMAFTANMEKARAPEKFFANVDTKLNITKTATYVTVTLIADALIVYRTFVIWGRNYWVAVIPGLLLFTDIGMSAWFTWSINQAKAGDSVLISNVFARCKYFYAVTFALNVLCTLLIAGKIWSIQRNVGGYKMGEGRLPNAFSIVVESAAIYSAMLIVLISTSIAGTSAMFCMLNSISPIIGSVFSYVILRSSSNTSRYETTLKSGSFGTSAATAVDRSYQSKPGHHSAFVEGGVQIHLEQIVHTHTDEEIAEGSARKISFGIESREGRLGHMLEV